MKLPPIGTIMLRLSRKLIMTQGHGAPTDEAQQSLRQDNGALKSDGEKSIKHAVVVTILPGRPA